MSGASLLEGGDADEVDRIAGAFLEAVKALLVFGMGERSHPRLVTTAAAKAMVFALAGLVVDDAELPARDALNLAAIDELLRSTVADMRSDA